MPKELEDCVTAYKEAHPDDSEDDAYAVCVAQYKKKHGHAPEMDELGVPRLLDLVEEPLIGAVDPEGQSLFCGGFEAVALVDGVIGTGGGVKKVYTRQFNDQCMGLTNDFMASGLPVTVYGRHGEALDGADMGMPRRLPRGRVIGPLYREGNAIKYRAGLVNTDAGREAMTHIRAQTIGGTSIRFDAASWVAEERVDQRTGESYLLPTRGRADGFDLALHPGIEGARITAVWSEEDVAALTPKATEAEQETTEESTMEINWEEITDAELTEHGLVRASVVGELQSKLSTAETALGAAQTQLRKLHIEAMAPTLAAAEDSQHAEALAAVMIPLALVSTEADPEKALKGVMEEAGRVVEGVGRALQQPPVGASGDVHEEEPPAPKPVTEELLNPLREAAVFARAAQSVRAR